MSGSARARTATDSRTVGRKPGPITSAFELPASAFCSRPRSESGSDA